MPPGVIKETDVMKPGEYLIDDVYEAVPDARAEIKYDGETIEKAICVGHDQSRHDSEQGALPEIIAALVRYKLSDEPEKWGGDEIIGKAVEVKLAESDWKPLRVVGRVEMVGAVRLTTTNEHV